MGSPVKCSDADICRRTRRLELHLRREATFTQKACPTGSHHMFGHFPFWRRGPADGKRQSKGGHHSGVLP